MPRIVLDITRLLTRAPHPIATGVDRVELAYARRALAQPAGQAGFAAIAGQRAVALPYDTAARFIRAIDAKWSGAAGDSGAAARVAAWLGAPPPASGGPGSSEPSRDEAARLAIALRARALVSPSRPPAGVGEIYLHVSHSRLDRPKPFEALKRAGALLVVLVHDLIPIRFPEYARPGEAARHARRMATALDGATALIANSRETARDLAAFAAETGRTPPPIVAAPLGLEAAFAPDVAPLEAARPYFLALGTIEPRKNHLLLLHLWRRLGERLGDGAPRLVLVGRRGWENEMVLDLLDRSPAIRASVLEANDLPDRALTSLVKGARALLFPSFSEGYGLPLAEALALGAAVIASDLPAFREISDGGFEALDPLDGPAWEAAVLAFARDPSPRREAALAAAKRFTAPGWDRHFEIVREVAGLD